MVDDVVLLNILFRRYSIDGERRSLQFSTFVKRGEEVSVDHSHDKAFSVLATQQSVGVRILSSLDPDVKYSKEKGVTCLGTIDVDMPGIGKHRGIEVRMFFGRTTIEVQVKNVQTGETKRSAVKFETA